MWKPKPWFDHPGLLDKAVQLWKEGRPASFIVEAMGIPGLSRCAVIGKLNRLGLARQPGRNAGRTWTWKNRGKNKVTTFVPKPKLEAPPSDGTFIYELAPRGCRYAIGERDGQHTFCNHTQQDGSSYCPYHAELCQPKRRLAA